MLIALFTLTRKRIIVAAKLYIEKWKERSKKQTPPPVKPSQVRFNTMPLQNPPLHLKKLTKKNLLADLKK
jgi:hypothetical protein